MLFFEEFRERDHGFRVKRATDRCGRNRFFDEFREGE